MPNELNVERVPTYYPKIGEKIMAVPFGGGSYIATIHTGLHGDNFISGRYYVAYRDIKTRWSWLTGKTRRDYIRLDPNSIHPLP